MLIIYVLERRDKLIKVEGVDGCLGVVVKV